MMIQPATFLHALFHLSFWDVVLRHLIFGRFCPRLVTHAPILVAQREGRHRLVQTVSFWIRKEICSFHHETTLVLFSASKPNLYLTSPTQYPHGINCTSTTTDSQTWGKHQGIVCSWLAPRVYFRFSREKADSTPSSCGTKPRLIGTQSLQVEVGGFVTS